MVNSPSEAEVGIEGLCEDKIYILFKADNTVVRVGQNLFRHKRICKRR